jgi:hypothetical protein
MCSLPIGTGLSALASATICLGKDGQVDARDTRKTDGQADRRTGRQTDRKKERQTDRNKYEDARQTGTLSADRRIDRQTKMKKYSHTNT